MMYSGMRPYGGGMGMAEMSTGSSINWLLIGVIIGSIVLGIIIGIILGKRAMKKRDI